MVIFEEAANGADVIEFRLLPSFDGGDPTLHHVEDNILGVGVVRLARLTLEVEELLRRLATMLHKQMKHIQGLLRVDARLAPDKVRILGHQCNQPRLDCHTLIGFEDKKA